MGSVGDGPDLPAEDLFRLYRPEWTVAFTACATPNGYTPEQVVGVCTEHFRHRYDGRVHNDDWRVVGHTYDSPAIARLELRLPVLKGEFVHRADAEAHAHEQGWETFAIVERHSRADHDLRNYGVKKLD